IAPSAGAARRSASPVAREKRFQTVEVGIRRGQADRRAERAHGVPPAEAFREYAQVELRLRDRLEAVEQLARRELERALRRSGVAEAATAQRDALRAGGPLHVAVRNQRAGLVQQ